MSSLLIAYGALFGMAMLPVFIGSKRSVAQTFEQTMSTKDAVMFPVIASGMLFGLYLLFKFLGKEYVNYLLSLYFLALGTYAVWGTVTPVIAPLFPQSMRAKRFSFSTNFWPLKLVLEPTTAQLSLVDLLTLLASGLLAASYFVGRHWILNNVLGLSFAIEGIALLSLGNFKIASLLLVGLFFYDIFWVFATDVMVTVAKSFDAPIKLLFPRVFSDWSQGFAMLGLGDIVFPGFMIAMLLRFDLARNKQAPSQRSSFVYFRTGLISYALALLATGVVLHVFQAAQPAMLYIVPALLAGPFGVAFVRGDLKALLAYTEAAEPIPSSGPKNSKEQQ